jgi:hypothetical protein
MKKNLLPLILLCISAPSAFADNSISVHNQLEPFTSDGCSNFPDGIPVIDPKRWRICCVTHDVAYWQGGTAEQRKAADTNLGACVGKTASPLLGDAMYLGVRLGGYTGLPLTWRWGYGWKQNRGYKKLSEEEKTQVSLGMKSIPKDLHEMAIISPPALIPERAALSGDYCLDEVAEFLSEKVDDDVRIMKVEESQEEKSEGWKKTISVTTTACEQPFQFTFLLLRPDACTRKSSELTARGRIRLQNVKKGCQIREESGTEETEKTPSSAAD